MSLRAGHRVSGWELESFLGKGGNSQVWLAQAKDGRVVALKILDNYKHDRYIRFKSEIEFMQSYSDPGIIPLIESYLPEKPKPSDPAWLAMPQAQPIVEALSLAGFLDVLAACLEIAETLSRLAVDGVSHRDVKPGNILKLDDRYLLGDFGLVSFPGKEDITEGQLSLGPRNFMAPEMLEEPDDSDGRKADVFSLAKTVWVLVTKKRFPPPGQLRVDETQSRVRRYVNHPRARALDRVLERATALDPIQRPDMRSVVDQLKGIVAPELSGTSLLDLGEETRRRAEERLMKLETQTDPANRMILFTIPAALAELAAAIEDADLGSGDVIEAEGLLNIRGRKALTDTPGIEQRWTGGAAIESVLDSSNRLGYLLSGFGLEYDDYENCILMAAHAQVSRGSQSRFREGQFLWVETRQFHLRDETAIPIAIEELGAALVRTLRQALQSALDNLA